MKRLFQPVADQLQELRELGLPGLAFRLAWELRQRSGLDSLRYRARSVRGKKQDKDSLRVREKCLPFSVPEKVAGLLSGMIGAKALERLGQLAEDAAHGRILGFGRWVSDFGDPIDWHLNPSSGQRWPADQHSSRVVESAGRVGDVKLTWEVGRFPQAFLIARAAVLHPGNAERWASSLLGQMTSFEAENPEELGVHWASGQEISFRAFAWLFAHRVLLSSTALQERSSALLVQALCASARHIERNIAYARHAVHNNHLLSEATGLLLVGTVLPGQPESDRWRALGRELLERQIPRQFYPDGGYIQQSHNYQRLALQVLLVAHQLLVAAGEAPLAVLDAALDRSVDFLTAFQNPADGRLPNYGANDGGLPLVLSTCDFSDFRPTLQAASLAARGERLYPEGPWDEEAAWLLGPDALDAPLREPKRCSRCFDFSGHHALRGKDPGSFGALRCGTLRDRFSQIDMLHLDVWWRGENVLVDGGSYLYNGPAEWHNHFVRTASHNTLTVDGLDQMVHHRKFKVLYWTQAERLARRESDRLTLVAGEHRGYERLLGCVHRRSVLFLKDDLWVVADTLRGTGEHVVRLHWLGGPYPHVAMENGMGARLDTPAGPFFVRVFGLDGNPLSGDVVAGREDPPRGWFSRYYGEKIPAPSFAVEEKIVTPWTCLSVLSGGALAELTRPGDRFELRHGGSRLVFHLEGGLFDGLEVG